MKAKQLLMFSTATAALAVAAPQAHAATAYASIFGGANFLSDPKLRGVQKTTTTTTFYQLAEHLNIDTSFKTGFVVGGNFGIDWKNGFRTEVELSYRQNKSKSDAVVQTVYKTYAATNTTTGRVHTTVGGTLTSGTTTVSADLRLNTWALMANVWYDIPLDMGFTPYVGGGIGGAQTKISGKLDGVHLYEKNDWSFAWQLGAGVSFDVAAGTKLFIDYRYFNAGTPALQVQPLPVGLGGASTGTVNPDMKSQSVMLGLRFDL